MSPRPPPKDGSRTSPGPSSCHHHPGFENNEGGFGELRWDLAADAIALDHGERVTEVAYSYDEGL